MNTHVHPVFAGVLSGMQPRPYPMHAERIEWWSANSARPIPDGRLLLKTRRGDRREGFHDGGVWRLADYTVADVVAYAEMPEGPL